MALAILTPNAPPNVAPTGAPTAELLQAAGVTSDLPQQLITDATGQPFAPVQLVSEHEVRTLPEQLALLLRPEPVGGAAALVHLNQRRLLRQAREHLHQRLAAGTPTQELLQRLRNELRGIYEQLEQRGQEVAQSYTRIQEQLLAWQGRMGQQGEGLLPQLSGWLFGGPGRLSLPQAITLWNEREQLALSRIAHDAASQLCISLLDEVSQLLDHLQALLRAARDAHTSAQQRLDTMQMADQHPAPWSWQLDVATVATVLAQRCSPRRLVALLLPRLVSDGADSLVAHVESLACQEAEHCLREYDIAGLIEVEASATPLEALDPIVVVGQALLEAMDRQVSWHLTRSARPRSELLQITPDGTPLFSMDGLQTAAYGADLDRVGFVEVQLGVALKDLRLMQASDEAFEAALLQRNLYVLEDLAQQAEARLADHDNVNGRTPHGATRVGIGDV